MEFTRRVRNPVTLSEFRTLPGVAAIPWLKGVIDLCVEKGIFNPAEIQERMKKK